MCTERNATGLFVLADFLCDNDKILLYIYIYIYLYEPAQPEYKVKVD